jgi:formylglycine-generating enzyme required for sulfatase activity
MMGAMHQLRRFPSAVGFAALSAVAGATVAACEDPFLVGASLNDGGGGTDGGSVDDALLDRRDVLAVDPPDAAPPYERCDTLGAARTCALANGGSGGGEAGSGSGVQTCIPQPAATGLGEASPSDAAEEKGWSRCIPTDCTTPPLDGRNAKNANEVCIPAGEFRMGGLAGDNTTEPKRDVTFRKRLFFDVFEVSADEWRAFWNEGQPSLPKDGTVVFVTGDGDVLRWSSASDAKVTAAGTGAGCTARLTPPRGNVAINCVGFESALAFCLAQGKRLPTEAEWEYVATGVTAGNAYPWGNDEPSPISREGCTRYVGLECRNGPNGPQIPFDRDHSRDGYSPLGIANLAGNVAEWTLDFAPAGGASCSTCYPPATVDPVALEATSNRVLRGGSMFSPLAGVRSRVRTFVPVTSLPQPDAVGFRCVREER